MFFIIIVIIDDVVVIFVIVIIIIIHVLYSNTIKIAISFDTLILLMCVCNVLQWWYWEWLEVTKSLLLDWWWWVIISILDRVGASSGIHRHRLHVIFYNVSVITAGY